MDIKETKGFLGVHTLLRPRPRLDSGALGEDQVALHHRLRQTRVIERVEFGQCDNAASD